MNKTSSKPEKACAMLWAIASVSKLKSQQYFFFLNKISYLLNKKNKQLHAKYEEMVFRKGTSDINKIKSFPIKPQQITL